MSPRFATHNFIDGRAGYVEAPSNIALAKLGGVVQAPNLQHVAFSEMTPAAAFAFDMPVLGAHVGQVVYVGAQKQMFGIAARSHVATVKYPHTRRDRPIGDFPGHPMRAGVASVFSADADFPITRLAFSARPELAPVFIRGGDKGKKPSLKRFCASGSAAFTGAKAPRSLPYCCRENFKLNLTGFADARDFARLAGSHKSLLNRFLGQARRGASTSRSGRFYFSTDAREFRA